MQRFLIALGVLMLAAGLAWPWLGRLPWGRLPGDISIVREGFSFHFPLMTSLLVSLVLSLLLWWFRRK
jgi:ribose/xylose/arabinose/galactoside ABC-type transport system permease subunit